MGCWTKSSNCFTHRRNHLIRLLNIVLLLACVIGIFFAILAGTEYHATQREHSRLTAKVGRLPISDPTKVHVLALDTGDPLDFAWLVYLPGQFKGSWKTVVSNSMSSTSGEESREPQTDLVRVKFRRIDGQWQMWNKRRTGSGLSSIPEGMFIDHPGSLNVMQMGQGQVEVVDTDQVATLLQIVAPPDQSSEGTFISMRLGSQAAWAKAAE